LMAKTSPVDPPALRLMKPPAQLRVPLGTHAAMGAPPGVVIGATVARGEVLAGAPAEGGPAALAPASGKIVGVGEVALMNGQVVQAVELESDFKDRRMPEEHDPHLAEAQRDRLESLDKVTPDDLGRWIDRLRAAGVWADRLHSPDLLEQLHQVFKRRVDTIICNLVDHDPTLRLQATMAGRFGPVLIAGVSLLARLVNARNVWFAVEAGGSPKWWLPLRRELRRSSIDIVPVLADYPQADPTMLIYTLLRRRLRPGRLPVEQGVLVLDAVSGIAVGRVATREQPMLQMPVAIRDHLRGRSHLLVAPVGTSVGHLLEHLELPAGGVAVLRGDALRDQPVSLDTVIAGGELTLHVLGSKAPVVSDPCIRCGWCAQTCPTSVHPAGLLEAAQRSDMELAVSYGLGACIECGICSYICPSHLPLLQGVRTVKREQHTPREPIGPTP